MSKFLSLRRMFLVMLALHLSVSDIGAQVNFIFNANAFGKDMKGLSALQMINISSSALTGNLEIEVRNVSGNNMLIKIFVRDISINPGNNIIPPSKFRLADILYAATDDGNYIKQTGMMPEADLEFCFKLVITSKDHPGDIYENCFTGTNIIGSPLQLTSPDHKDEFCNKRPAFTWQPPMPLTQGMTFTLKVVEIGAGQTAAEAVLNNTPIIYQSHIKSFRVSYPAGIPELKEDRSYAWQVTATSKGRQSISEVWDFSILCIKQQIDSSSYRELRTQDDGGFLTTGSSLKFAVYNLYIKQKLQYEIVNLANRSKRIRNLPIIDLQKGENNILVDLNKIPGMEDGDEYLLSVTMPDGKKVSLRFKYDEDYE